MRRLMSELHLFAGLLVCSCHARSINDDDLSNLTTFSLSLPVWPPGWIVCIHLPLFVIFRDFRSSIGGGGCYMEHTQYSRTTWQSWTIFPELGHNLIKQHSKNETTTITKTTKKQRHNLDNIDWHRVERCVKSCLAFVIADPQSIIFFDSILYLPLLVEYIYCIHVSLLLSAFV